MFSPPLDSPSQERFKPPRSRSSLSLSNPQRKILLSKFSSAQPERRCLTARLSRSSSSSDFSLSSSESRKRFSESDKENDEVAPPSQKRRCSFDLDGIKAQPLLLEQKNVNYSWGFQQPRRFTTEDSDLDECGDTESDSDDDGLVFFVETSPTEAHITSQDMQVETPVKGMAQLKIRSPVPESPYHPTGRSQREPPESPYVCVQRGTSFGMPCKIPPLQERQQEQFNLELAKCVEATNTEYVPYLPLLPKTSSRLNCISPTTVADLVNNVYRHRFDSVIIIDCRYVYEYEGGHIRGAVNCPCPEKVDELFLNFPPSDRVCFVFHCEFSSHRGPKGYTRIRSADRQKNLNCYPALHYPEMYLLEGGYKAFYEQFKELCHPQNYIPMREEEFRDDLRTSQGVFKKKPAGGLQNSKRYLSKSCSNIFEGMSVEDDELFAPSPKKTEVTQNQMFSWPSQQQIHLDDESQPARRRFLSEMSAIPGKI